MDSGVGLYPDISFPPVPETSLTAPSIEITPPVQEAQPTISLNNDSERTNPLPAPVINQRAVKASIATGMPADQLATAFTSPQAEAMLRNSVSQQAMLDRRQKQLDLVDQMAKDGPMTSEKAQYITALTNDGTMSFDKNAMEGLFAKNAMQMSYANMATPKYAEAADKDFNKLDAMHTFGENTATISNYLGKKSEENANWDTYGGKFGYAYYFAKGFIPTESTYAQYDKYAQAWDPGSNMKEQVQKLYMMPPDRAIAWIDARYASIAKTNPIDAQNWLTSMKGVSSLDTVLANVMPVVDVATTVLPFGKLAKAGEKGLDVGLKGTTEASQALSDAWKANAAGESVAAKGAADLQSGDMRGAFAQGPGTSFAARDVTEGSLRADVTKGPGAPVAARDLTGNDLRSQILKDHGWSPTQEPSAVDQAGKGIADTARVLSAPKIDPVEALANTGNTEAAVKLNVVNQIAAKEAPTADSDLDVISRKLMGIHNPVAWLSSAQNLAREASDRIINQVAVDNTTRNKILTNPQMVTRLNKEAQDIAYQKASDDLKDKFTQLSDHIVDMKFIPQEPDSHLNFAEIRLGKSGGTSFPSYADAKQAADNLFKLPEGTYRIPQKGGAYYVGVRKALNETAGDVTKVLVNTKNTTPRTFANTVLRFFRSPEDLLSKTQRDARSVASPLAQETQRLFASSMGSIKALTKGEYDRVNNVMKVNRDTVVNGERGKWFESAKDFEDAFFVTNKQYPNEKEYAAYMTTRQLSDFDWAVRSFGILKDKAYQGLERIRLHVPVSGATIEEGGTGLVHKTFEFDGKVVDALPVHRGGYDPGVSIIGPPEDIKGTSKWSRLSKVDRAEVERLQKEEGYKLYQSGSDMDTPFKDYLHLPVEMREANSSFYLMKGGERNSLRVDQQLPYKAGYHVEYPPGFYTKAPMFRTAVDGAREYIGDKSILHHDSQNQAIKYQADMETARQLYNSNDSAGLQTFLQKNLPHTFDEFGQLYSKHGLDPKTPFFYTKTGQTVKDAARTQNGDLHAIFKGVGDPGDSEYNLMNYVNRHYAQEKNIELPSVADGTEGKPVFKFGVSQNISPLSTMSRAIHEMTRLRVYDDYVKQATQSLIEEFSNPESLGGSVTRRAYDSIRRNPISFLSDPQWDENVLDRNKLAAAKNSYRALTELLSNQSDASRSLNWVGNKLLNYTYDKLGDKATGVVAGYLNTKITDPVQFMRSVAFNAKIGLFNPLHVWLMGQQLIHTAAITGNPLRSMKAVSMSAIMRGLSMTDNPDIIAAAAKKAEFFGVNKDQFIEAHTLMKDSGVWNIGGDHASIDDMMTPALWSGKGKQFLDKGSFFFKETERYVRMNAFNTAYLEHIDAGNVVGSLTKDSRAFASSLTRYDDLALNMTRKSTAAFQKGVFGLPTQFMTFPIHLMEQMLGSRLTIAERARLVGTYSTLYGIPAGVTAAMPLVDWSGDVKEAAMTRGVNVDDGVYGAMMHGVMNMATQMITGKATDISEHSGPMLVSPISDYMSGKKGAMEILGGASLAASGDLIKGIYKVATPTLYSVFRSSPSAGGGDFEVRPEDIVDFLRNVQSVNNGLKLYNAANFHAYYDKYGNKTVDGVDAMDGALSFMLGADPRRISDRFLQKDVLKQISDGKLAQQSETMTNLERAFQSMGDPVDYARYLKQAKMSAIAAGIDDRTYSNLVEQVSKKASVSLVDQTNAKWQKQFPPELLQQIPSMNEDNNQ